MDRWRIFGIETEFGCLVHDPAAGTPEKIVDRVKTHVFTKQKLGVIDLHARDYTFEPARAGMVSVVPGPSASCPCAVEWLRMRAGLYFFVFRWQDG